MVSNIARLFIGGQCAIQINAADVDLIFIRKIHQSRNNEDDDAPKD